MIFHMKTTLNIPESLMKELKKRAAENGQTLSETLADVLQKGLQPQRAKTKLRKLPVHDCGKVFVNIADRDQLYRAMEGR
jgi:plasmid stability protein